MKGTVIVPRIVLKTILREDNLEPASGLCLYPSSRLKAFKWDIIKLLLFIVIDKG